MKFILINFYAEWNVVSLIAKHSLSLKTDSL
jgi:hypothetical protein